MIELFEQNLRTNDRNSSKGNQLKWKNNDVWYKADYTGYEGLSEYVISHLLKYSNLKESDFVLYDTCQIKYKDNVFNGVSSKNFLKSGWQVITLERLFKNKTGRSLHEAMWLIQDHTERMKYLIEEVEKITNLKNFGKYMNILFTIDCMFLNEDRHTHNIAVLMNDDGEFQFCPIFDNGAGLLSDTSLDYKLGGDLYKMIDSVKAKTISLDFEEQLNISEILYGTNLVFSFTKKDVIDMLCIEKDGEASIYDIELRKRVCNIIFEQMRKYPYLFN